MEWMELGNTMAELLCLVLLVERLVLRNKIKKYKLFNLSLKYKKKEKTFIYRTSKRKILIFVKETTIKN